MKTNFLKPFCFLLILLLAAGSTFAQRLPFNGYLLDSVTHLPIAGGTLTNAASRQAVRTDSTGFFSLQAAPNEVVHASAANYQFDTLTFSFLFTDTAIIYLAPAGDILPNVTVSSRYNRYQLDSIERRTAFIENRGTKVPAVSANNNGAFGVGINLDRFFKKKYKDQKGDERLFNSMEKSAYVAYRYSPQLVAYYTGLKGNALRDFMARYSPTYSWLRQHLTNDDVLFYINDKLKEYRAAQTSKTF